jgi:ParB family transcriptional regulator, chromosome partitioning protein
VIELPLDKIECNKFNSRGRTLPQGLSSLALSMSKHGQLVSVGVRPSSLHLGMYELVYGHRRFFAARQIGKKTIRAEVFQATDEEMLRFSLIENTDREDLSDYEKALVFERMNKEFGVTYDQIGEALGVSKQSICNYIAMLRLFHPDELKSDTQLAEDLYRITEHHARILSHVDDKTARADLVHLVVKEHLSVRDLSKITGRLRCWFEPKSNRSFDLTCKSEKQPTDSIQEVKNVIRKHFELIRGGTFEEFAELHLFEDGFSMFSAFAPHELVVEEAARSQLEDWFHKQRGALETELSKIRVKVRGDAAVATMIITYKTRRHESSLRSRGTLVLVNEDGLWKIFHEHFSADLDADQHPSTEPRINPALLRNTPLLRT